MSLPMDLEYDNNPAALLRRAIELHVELAGIHRSLLIDDASVDEEERNISAAQYILQVALKSGDILADAGVDAGDMSEMEKFRRALKTLKARKASRK